MNIIIKKWHNKLDMPKHDLDWHINDIKEEMQELEEAKGFIDRWSEFSDLSYSYTRSLWAGHDSIKRPLSYPKYLFGLIYMFPKYQLRWNFFVDLGNKFNKDNKYREIRNPKRLHKLEFLAEKYGFDKEAYTQEAKKLMKKRFLLK